MALKPGSIIRVNEFLSVNDYIQSPNRVFFAIMQGDGNFCVYRGTGPDDNHGYLWGTQATGPGGQFFAVMQDDGNFCVYRGTNTGDNRGYLWGTQAIDPVEDYEISSIVYEVGKAKVLRSSPADLYSQHVINNLPNAQTSTISGSTSVSHTSAWSDSLAVKVGVKTSFKCGVPLLAEGKVDVSLEVSNTYTWSGSETRTITWSFSTPVTVLPGMEGVVLASATISTIAVPYTLTGTFIFRSGKRMPGQIKGLYTGTNSHDFKVNFHPLVTGTLEQMESSTQALKATATYTAES